MDCAAFFEAVASLDADARDPRRDTVDRQCVYEFYHPGVHDRLGDNTLAASFNCSGVVWAPPGRRLRVQLRVPETDGDAVATALADAPPAFELTDHRGVSTPDGDVVTVLHFGTRGDGVSDGDLRATLSAVAAATAV